MEAGAAFLLLLILIFVAIVGGGLWLLSATLRRRKLNPEEDKLDRQMLEGRAGDAGAAPSNGDAPREDAHPEHTHVSSEQHSRSIPRQ
ncbi:MAG: hypothetical protein ACTHM1_11615 [Solirubrobacteraceae bacterium]